MNEVQAFAVVCVLIFICFDIVSGFAYATKAKNISSQALREGFFHKFAIILLLFLAVLLNYVQGIFYIGLDIPLVEVSAGYLVIMEVISILENIGKINPELMDNPLFKLLEIAVDEKKNKE